MKTKILILFIAAIFVFSLVTFYQYYNEDTSALEDARAVSDSTLIKSAAGITRYKVFGEKNIPTVILIHSFNGFIESWDPNISALVNAGYRVVAYDLFGRGLSDRPYVDYDLELFRNQLDSVLKKVGAKNIHLIGSSFGCVIASDYANHHPEKIESLIMIGPAGWPQEDGRNPLIDIPIVSELAFHLFGKKILKPKVEAYFFNPSKHLKVLEEWENFASHPGFTRSALSTLKHSPVLDYTTGWEQLGTLNKPTLFIWGKQDVSFPYSNTKELKKIIPDVKIIGIDDAAHWVNIEQAELVNSEIIEFLRVNRKSE